MNMFSYASCCSLSISQNHFQVIRIKHMSQIELLCEIRPVRANNKPGRVKVVSQNQRSLQVPFYNYRSIFLIDNNVQKFTILLLLTAISQMSSCRRLMGEKTGIKVLCKRFDIPDDVGLGKIDIYDISTHKLQSRNI